ncbi:MAG: B3/4 domain-containing protein [Planctomycetota bacterium]|nr:B3/4 domain-containing protein [Planctomycetota bacterium]
MIEVESHPLLDAVAIRAELPGPQGEQSPEWLQQLLTPAGGPESVEVECKKHVRALLRHGGYRPAGRGKPSSEWLVAAAARGALASILPLVDAGNAVSRSAGIPLSVVDLDRVQGPLKISLGSAGESYIFNRSDQSIDLAGLLCLRDGIGPCANAVKDSQRSKTDASSRNVLIVIWGTIDLPGAARRMGDRVQQLLERLGAEVEDVEFQRDGPME